MGIKKMSDYTSMYELKKQMENGKLKKHNQINYSYFTMASSDKMKRMNHRGKKSSGRKR